MKHFWVLLIGVFLALLATFIPLGAAFYLSWVRAVNYEESRLAKVTHELFDRVWVTYSNVENTLISLNKLNIIKPCSPAHIKIMRDVTLNNQVIEEVIFFEKKTLKCSTWGLINVPQNVFNHDLITRSGLKVALNIRSVINQDKRMIAIHQGNYYALVDPTRFSDIIIDSNIKVALFSIGGTLIAALNKPDLSFIQRYLFDNKKQDDEKYMISTLSNERIIAVAMENKSTVYKILRQEQFFLVPIGFIMALPLIAVVIYYSRRRLSIESELYHAVKNKELIVYYQPIIDLKTKHCIGAEALIRWFPSKQESISPDAFIPIAEKIGLIAKITELVIDTVISDMKTLLIKDRNLHISINFSASDFQDANIIPFLESKIANTGILRSQIWLEITERSFVKLDAAKEIICQLRELGYLFAMDDFGTGYSNLSYLQRLSLDIVKIDKLFVDSVGLKYVTSGVIGHMIQMAKHLNLKIVAEGVEKDYQSNYLLEKGVHYGQGWLFSKALNKTDFIEYYQVHHTKDNSVHDS